MSEPMKHETIDEVWKAVKGFEDVYEVSNIGNLRSLDRTVVKKNGAKVFISGKNLSIKPRKGEYTHYSLLKNGFMKPTSLHRIVAEAFIPNDDLKPTVNHIDGEKSNNNVDNLEWATYPEQASHAYKKGLTVAAFGKDSTNGRKTHCIHGHILEGNNLYIVKSKNERRCVMCNRKRAMEYYYRKKALENLLGGSNELHK